MVHFSAMPRIVYASDLHASIPHYETLFQTALTASADAVILGGDLLPDDLSGHGLAATQTRWVQEVLGPMLVRYREKGLRRVLAIPGNHDTVPGAEAMARTAVIETIHGRAVELGTWYFVGCPFVPPTPFIVKDFERLDAPGEADEPQPERAWISSGDAMTAVEPAVHFRGQATIAEELDRLPWREGRTALVCHCPPWDTNLDMMYGPRHIGSRAVRRFIEERKPRITLHGHIHESLQLTGEYAEKLGDSYCYNAGQAARSLHMLTIELGRPGEKPFVEHRRLPLRAKA
jgi:Icc-related predicted phosphoesterase